MSIAFSRVTSSFRPVDATPLPPVHWPSAFVGLFLAVLVVVSIAWLAAPRRVDRPLPAAVAPLPVVQVAPTPIPAPAVAAPEPAPVPEKVKVANTGGSNLNLRANAGERSQRLKSVPEGSLLEIVGADQTADGVVWRNVRDASGASGFVAAKFVVKTQ
ncbi:MAG: SH3 domain-containing protein [Chloroflexi bacterium]|nr:SH3 domain-containing protein [Chloroflexota bacterium]